MHLPCIPRVLQTPVSNGFFVALRALSANGLEKRSIEATQLEMNMEIAITSVAENQNEQDVEQSALKCLTATNFPFYMLTPELLGGYIAEIITALKKEESSFLKDEPPNTNSNRTPSPLGHRSTFDEKLDKKEVRTPLHTTRRHLILKARTVLLSLN